MLFLDPPATGGTMATIILILATAAAAYILSGYPLLLWFLSRRPQHKSIQKDLQFTPTVTALLAVHNGQDFLAAKLDSLLALDYQPGRLDIIVLSDGSTDQTNSIAERYFARGVKLLALPRAGKAATLNAGLPHTTGEILLFTDVRQAFDPAALRHLVANFADPAVGAVTGELRFVESEREGEQADMDLYWRYELWVRTQHSRIDSVFNTTGCIYAMRRSLVRPIPPDTLTDDAVLPLQAFRAGYRIVFEPNAIAFDFPTVAKGEFRRRMRTLAGLWQVYGRHPWLLLPGRMRGHFLSHKFGRLALPWLLITIAAATVALPASPWRTVLLWNEALFLTLAAADSLVPAGLPIKRLTSPASTFFVMNLAALLSILVFVLPIGVWWKAPTRVALPSKPQ